MKKTLIIISLVAVIGIALVFTGCNVVDDVKNWADQLTCEHVNLDEPDEKVPATCTSAGYEIYRCSLCGRKETVELPIEQHKTVEIAPIAATCIKEGYTSGLECSECKQIVVKPVVVPASGHIEVIDKAVPATCLSDGLTEGKHCSVCDEIIVKQKVISAFGHKVQELGAKAPTCTEPGLTKGYKCYNCGDVFTAQVEIPALGHSFDENMVCEECDLEFSFELIASSPNNTEKPLVGETLSQGLYSYSGLISGVSAPSATLTFSEAKYLNGNTFSSNQEGFDEPLALMFSADNLYLVSGDEILTSLDFGGLQLPPGWTSYTFFASSDSEGYKDATDGVEHYVHDATILYMYFTDDTISLTFCADESGKLFTESTTLIFNLSDLVFAEVNTFNKVIM